MIPAYSEEVKITVVEADSDLPLIQQVKQLQEQVRQLTETVEFMNREKSRLKSDVEQLKSIISRG